MIMEKKNFKRSSPKDSAIQIFDKIYPEHDRQSDEEADRFFDMDFKAGGLVETPLADNLTKY